MNKILPVILYEVPDEYLIKSRYHGRVEMLEYDTYDAFSYEQKDKPLKKKACIYLPYGYDERKKYNVLYLMHGGGGYEGTFLLGDDGSRNEKYKCIGFKNIIDHGIEDGKIDPLIIVCPTYNNEDINDSHHFGRAIELTRHYPRELVNDLIPAVEQKYSSYAMSTDKDGLMKSRDHRAFGGFSMGAVTTWRVFDSCLDCFRFFIPVSGNLGDGQMHEEAVKRSGYSKEDFFIFTVTGSEDFARDNLRKQIINMGNEYSDTFKIADTMDRGNIVYREVEGAYHDYRFANQYIYNALMFLTEDHKETSI